MYDELTRGDVQKMQEEIDYRTQVLRPKLIEDVQTARAFGDLSENFEYKCAKQEKNRNDSRIRYLQRMIKTARIIDDRSGQDTAGLYDTVEIFMENTGKSRRIQLVTTLRQELISSGFKAIKIPAHRLFLKEGAGCTEGPHQQGVPGREGRAGPPGRGPGTGGYGRRPQLLDHHSFH